MGKVKLLLDVIGDLRSLADSLQAVADAVADNGAAEAGRTDTKEPEKAGKAGKAAKKEEKPVAKQEPEEKPLTLEEVRAVLAEKSRAGHTEEVRELLNKHGADKLSEGKDLIRYFCVPCRPTKTNGGRTRNLPEHDREKWERFKEYNFRDVEAEMQIQQRLAKFPVLDFVWEEYWQDQEINDRGIGVDMEMVARAIAMDGRSKSELSTAMQELGDMLRFHFTLHLRFRCFPVSIFLSHKLRCIQRITVVTFLAGKVVLQPPVFNDDGTDGFLHLNL